MFCENCGKEIKEGASFCSECESLQNIPEQKAQENSEKNIQAVPKAKNIKRLLIGIIGIIAVIVLSLVILISVFGNSLSVEDTKTGYLPYFSESKTIGSVFDNYSYFDDISWEKFEGETEDGEEVSVVEFNAIITMENADSYDDYNAEGYINETLTVQFYSDGNMDSDEFSIYGIWFSNVDGKGTDINLNDYDFDDILNCIYEDEIFLLAPSDYDLYYYN